MADPAEPESHRISAFLGLSTLGLDSNNNILSVKLPEILELTGNTCVARH